MVKVEEALKLLREEPDAVKRMHIRLDYLPLGYLATTESKVDIKIILDRLAYLEGQ